MNKRTAYAIVLGRLMLAGVLLVFRWAVFEPIYFIGTLVSSIGEAGLNGLNSIINAIQKDNEQLLTKNK